MASTHTYRTIARIRRKESRLSKRCLLRASLRFRLHLRNYPRAEFSSRPPA